MKQSLKQRISDWIYDQRMKDRLPPLSKEVKAINRRPPRWEHERQRRKKIPKYVLCAVAALIVIAELIPGEYVPSLSDMIGAVCSQEQTLAQYTCVSDGDIEIHCIDVGQGDSMLIRAGGADILIDAGERGRGKYVSSYLTREGVEDLEWAICTHPHSDHIGGMDEVLERIPTKNVMLLELTEGIEADEPYEEVLEIIEKKGINAKYARQGDEYIFGSLTMTVLAPFVGSEYTEQYTDTNDYSITLRFQCGEISLFTGGDISEVTERQLVVAGLAQPCTVYRASHHGSRSSSCEELLDALRPQYCLISCGKNNDYGHPHNELLERLESRGIVTERTDREGSLMYRWEMVQGVQMLRK